MDWVGVWIGTAPRIWKKQHSKPMQSEQWVETEKKKREKRKKVTYERREKV